MRMAALDPDARGCEYCELDPAKKHPVYVYLSSDMREMYDGSLRPRGEHKIGLATLPDCRIHQNNRRPGYHTGAKSTNLKGEFWQAEVVIGPFWDGGSEFRHSWRANARGITNRYRALKTHYEKFASNADFVARNRGCALGFFCRDPLFTKRVFESKAEDELVDAAEDGAEADAEPSENEKETETAPKRRRLKE